ncbi:hypothetical protein ACFQ7N_40445, partial [Streptomyces niveus]
MEKTAGGGGGVPGGAPVEPLPGPWGPVAVPAPPRITAREAPAPVMPRLAGSFLLPRSGRTRWGPLRCARAS